MLGPSAEPVKAATAGGRPALRVREEEEKKKEMVQPGGVEPPTYRSVVCRSIQLSYGCTALPDAEDYRIGGGGGNRAPVPQRTPNG